MALALDPAVIIADEPTTALDVTVQAEILDLLRRLRDETGTAIVLITHNMGVVADLADRVAVMLNGEVVETAPSARSSRRRSTSTRSDCSPPCRASSSSIGAAGVGGCRGRARRRGEGSRDRVPRAPRSPTFRAVHAIDFAIRPGEVLGLVGESGRARPRSGARSRAHPGRGRVAAGARHRDERRQERRFRARRKELGFVFQDPATSFNPLLTIAQCVAEPLIVHGGLGCRRRPRPRRRAARGGAAAEVRRPVPHELSGGQRQRASSRARSRSTRSC
jgi:peptide/nickel transport system ATP-binding protein